ncbi:MAG: hypothetical protein AB7O97_14390 [Planctomycetota bacterium]
MSDDAGGRVRLRIDPWAAEYDGAQGQLDLDEPAAAVDVAVERADWTALRPATDGAHPKLVFVDGVRRIDCRFVAEDGDRRRPGLFGSFAVGAVESGGAATLLAWRTGRVAAVTRGLPVPALTVQVGGSGLRWSPEVALDDTPDAPLRVLQNAMRRAEAELAATVADAAAAVIVDGPLTAGLPRGPFLGYVKRLLRGYLPEPQAALLPRMQPGERTPLFAIAGPPLDRFSWYLRLAHGRAIDSDLAGVVRCECALDLGLDAARALADLAARELPRFASDALRDARAPQNLFPIGALETALRHRLGEPLLLRRALEAAVAGAHGHA